MAYEWIHGFSQCWPPGSECEVWWDAWVVVVAAMSLLVALLTMAVTAASAVAVFLLGSAANGLAEDADRRSEAVRRREARVLAGYLLPEVRQTAGSTGRLLEALGGMTSERFVLGGRRTELLREVEGQQMPLTASVIDRLHVLPSQASDNITDALGNLALALKTAKGFEVHRGTVEDDLRLAVLAEHLRHAHAVLTIAVAELNSMLEKGS
ncbi:hypothetical protein [Stenotrophomonas maltophilia]|uniref:hypothetical protein n=1 Tax=Stenotrophomonas maltophilia TaxID=40324 RepID=UPI002E7814B6|nr:hypothetical protein [Stenotrophomonas maltophilia]